MDKKGLKRHDIVFITSKAKTRLLETLLPEYNGESHNLLRDILQGDNNIPGIVRRGDDVDNIAIGFVHCHRIDGNRFRIATKVCQNEIERIMDPYDVLQRKIYAQEHRTKCIIAAAEIYDLALVYGIHVGVFGSVSMELVTGLPYTDDDSDLDFLIKATSLDKLKAFYTDVKCTFPKLAIDFEVELPNGYGVKLAELFMETRTVLGKGLKDVKLLNRDDIIEFLK